jgi:hypothetical protein
MDGQGAMWTDSDLHLSPSPTFRWLAPQKKIESYEALTPSTLNADQKAVLEKKSETLMLAKELEDIVKALHVVESEEGKEKKKERAEQEEETQRKIGEAVGAQKVRAQRASRLRVVDCLLFSIALYLKHHPDTRLKPPRIPMPPLCLLQRPVPRSLPTTDSTADKRADGRD